MVNSIHHQRQNRVKIISYNINVSDNNCQIMYKPNVCLLDTNSIFSLASFVFHCTSFCRAFSLSNKILIGSWKKITFDLTHLGSMTQNFLTMTDGCSRQPLMKVFICNYVTNWWVYTEKNICMNHF